MLTQARLQEVLRYEPETGEFFWRVPRGRPDYIGKRAGWITSTGYRGIMIDDRSYQAHRLAWLYVYGAFPESAIDHKNRQRVDNRITNLRLASTSQNSANGKSRLSHGGLKGAYWFGRYKKWSSVVSCNGKRHFLGYFATAEEAHAAYCEAARKLHGPFFWPGK
jgi:hypothetical protein